MLPRRPKSTVLNSQGFQRIYSNKGNLPLINMLSNDCKRLLDIGCGAGDNATLIKTINSKCEIFGITYSSEEAELAQNQMVKCWVFDIENDLPEYLTNQTFDVLIFSHVLEHLRNPEEVVAKFSQLLVKGGQVLIAVPNILSWRMRFQFLLGDFEYESAGTLDDTHLRFFTYLTADGYLLSKSPDLKLVDKIADGSVPLWLLRRYILPKSWCVRIDAWVCRQWPNLFGGQILLKVAKH